MFRRRDKRGAWRRIGNVFWPEIGIRRWALYQWHRLGRLPGPAYTIAAGFACGAAISMTPFVGFHFVLSALLAWIIGANIVAGLFGTIVGNPWTFPFIWAWTHKLGLLILGRPEVAPSPETTHFTALFADVFKETLRLNMAYLFDQVWPLIWPMVVGSVPTAFVTWLVFYFVLLRLIGGYQRQRAKRVSRRHAERMAAQTGASATPLHIGKSANGP